MLNSKRHESVTQKRCAGFYLGKRQGQTRLPHESPWFEIRDGFWRIKPIEGGIVHGGRFVNRPYGHGQRMNPAAGTSTVRHPNHEAQQLRPALPVPLHVFFTPAGGGFVRILPRQFGQHVPLKLFARHAHGVDQGFFIVAMRLGGEHEAV